MTANPNQPVDSTPAPWSGSRRLRALGPPEGAEGGTDRPEGGDRAAPFPASAPTAGVDAASIGPKNGGTDGFGRSPHPSGTAAAERLRAVSEAEEGWRRFAEPDTCPAGSTGAGASVFLGESQREAFAAIGRALADRRLCVAVTGPAGAGKTALLEAVLTEWPGVASRVFRIEASAEVDEAQAERIVRTGLGSRRGPEGGASRLARSEPPPPAAAGTDADGRPTTTRTEAGAPASADRGGSRGDPSGANRSERGLDGVGRASGGNALLVVDDAHEASPLLLRCLARVAAAGRDGRRSAQILLVGRPELWDRLRHDAFAPLARRLVLRLDLKPWTETDARGYIAHLLARPRRVEGQALAPDAEQEVLHRARARPDRIGALVGAALARVDRRTRSAVTRDDVLAVNRARIDAARTDAARTDAARIDAARADAARTDDVRTDDVRTGPRMDRDDRPRDGRREGVHPAPPRLAAFVRSPFGVRGAAVAAAVALAVVGTAAGGILLFRQAPPPAAPVPGQAAPASAPDGSAERRSAEGAPAPLPADRDGSPRDPVAPTPPNRGAGIGGGAATEDGTAAVATSPLPPRSTPPGRPEDAGAPGIPGEPSPAPTGGDPAPADERAAGGDPPDAPSGSGRQAVLEGETVARAEGAAPAGAGERSPVQPPAARSRDPAEAPSAPLSPAVLAALMRRGDEMLAGGDPAGARRFYERAAASGSAPGMRGMARTFDPAVIGRDDEADPTTAAVWYARAAAFGDTDATARLMQLQGMR